MKRKDPLKNLTNQTKANVSFLMMSSPNGTISSNVALNRRKTTEVIIYTLLNRRRFTHPPQPSLFSYAIIRFYRYLMNIFPVPLQRLQL